LSVRGKRLDGCVRTLLARQRFAEQIEKEIELDPVHAAQRGQAQRLVPRKAVASAGDLRRLFTGERREPRLRLSAIDDGAWTAASGVAASLTESWRDAQRRAREPAGSDRFAGGFPCGERGIVDSQVTRGRKGKGGAPQAMRVGVGRRLGEPARKREEVGGAVRALMAAFVELRDHGEQRRNRGARARAQELRLRRAVRVIEPAAQTVPLSMPPVRRRGEIVRGRLQRVREVALREQAKRVFEIERGDFAQCGADPTGGEDELAEEAIEMVDQRILVGEKRLELDAVQFDRTLQTAHERLCAGRELLETCHERLKREVHAIAVRFRGELQGKLVEQREQIAECGHLQLARSVQVLEEGVDRLLRGFAFGAELIEIT
jgi:hypothetical protein